MSNTIPPAKAKPEVKKKQVNIKDIPYITTTNADHGYRVKNEQTTRYKLDNGEGSEKVVIQGWIVVKEIRKNYKTGGSVYVLMGKDKRGKEFEIALPADVFYGQPWRLKAAIAPHFDLKTGFFLESGKDNLQNIIAATTNDE